MSGFRKPWPARIAWAILVLSPFLTACRGGFDAPQSGTVSLDLQAIWPKGTTGVPAQPVRVGPETVPGNVVIIRATVTVGSFYGVKSFAVAANPTGADFPGVPAGSGSATLDALDASNTVLYTGTSNFTGAAGQTVGVSVTMTSAPGQPPWGNPGPYTVGGTISGLTSGDLVLQDNGGDNLTVSANATTFTFVTKVAYGASYNVTVLTQPTGLTCTVNSGSGTMGAGNMTNVSLVCSANAYTVGGTISGLSSGSSITLLDNGGDSDIVTLSGSGPYNFTFATNVAYGAVYTVTATSTGYTCTGGSGTMGAGNVTNVSVVCSVIDYLVGGSISGLTATGLVLQNNGTDNLTVSANKTTFTFASKVAYGAGYSVTLLTQPANLACTVASGSGTVSASDVMTVSIACTSAWHNISAGQNYTMAIKEDGTLWGWGVGGSGNLGIGSYTSSSTPVQAGTSTTWSKVSAALQHTEALKSDGTLWAWGDNTGGKLGIGNTLSQSSPIQVGGATTWMRVSAGWNHTMGVQTDNTLWAWGANGNGELGIGSTANGPTSPVQVGSGWREVSAGDAFTVAIKTDGTLWAWGLNDEGQLGIGNTTQQTSPVQEVTGSAWSVVAAGFDHTVAIKTDGTLWAWGWNGSGQLGIGSTSPGTCSGSPCAMTPQQVGSAKTWIAVSVNNEQTLALMSDGTLWAWGADPSGVLGIGNPTSQNSPVQVGTGTAWSAVSTGQTHTAALMSDNTLWVWGNDNSGQLGLGNTTEEDSPVRLP